MLSGNTVSPNNFQFLNLITKGNREIPDEGILTAGVPLPFLQSFRLLQHYGKLDFQTIAKYAKSYAKNGFPIHNGIVNQKKFGLIDLKLKFKNEWVNSYKLYINENKKYPK